MSSILDKVNQRTQLVGENRLELLTFKLRGRQLYAINVFKVQEVVALPKLTSMPNRHPSVVGVTHLRGHTIPVIDLSQAIGNRPIATDGNRNIVVTEYNLSIQAFLVGGVDRIVNLNWEEISPPPPGTGKSHFLTAITRLDGEIVEIVDVERVLSQIIPYDTSISGDVYDERLAAKARELGLEVLLVDDSGTALRQASETLSTLGMTIHTASNGQRALDLLNEWKGEENRLSNKLAMVITDAEMPEMDGYRLTSEIRKDPLLKDLFVVLHTSLSGKFNESMVEKVGCDEFISKFQPNILAEVVLGQVSYLLDQMGIEP